MKSDLYQEPTRIIAFTGEHCALCGGKFRVLEEVIEANGDQYHDDCWNRP